MSVAESERRWGTHNTLTTPLMPLMHDDAREERDAASAVQHGVHGSMSSLVVAYTTPLVWLVGEEEQRREQNRRLIGEENKKELTLNNADQLMVMEVLVGFMDTHWMRAVTLHLLACLHWMVA